ncbi:hypothetical protein PG993_001164 [Apiospora rasikravindrae]|uniref:Acyltransferase 3 domain-containing protein n=1 Tax=Apiospora rasikravindrae TaxID=990691 RepID=A0ABR1UAM8_9PEZI
MSKTRSEYADVEARGPLVDTQYFVPDGNDAEEGPRSSLLSEEKQSRRGSRAWPRYTRLWGFSSPGVSLATKSVLRLLILLAPSFVTSLVRTVCNARRRSPAGGRAAPKRPLSPTAYLDGVRGVAALVVYVFHWSYLWFPFLRQGWHSSADVSQTDLFLQRPVVRVLHSGRASVTVFFVVSGYVVAVKTLTMIHRGQPDRALDALAGSLFRRPLRLYLPIVVATLISLMLVRCDGIFQKDPTGAGAPPRGDTLRRQLWHWWAHMVHMVNPFRNIDGRANLYSPPYDGNLWTIPIEFKGSLLVFVLLLAFMKAKRWLHIAAALWFTFWLAQLGELDMALFCLGMLLAELSLVFPPGDKSSEPDNTVSTTGNRPRHSLRTFRHVATLFIFFIALHLLSYPENGGYKSPGFRTLSIYVPIFYRGLEDKMQWFWISVGSVLFILALMYSPPLSRYGSCGDEDTANISHISTLPVTAREPSGAISVSIDTGRPEKQPQNQPLLQRPFTTAFAQYLGRISYALYLAHGTVNHTVGTCYLNPAWYAWLSAEAVALDLRGTGLSDAADAVLYRSWSTYVDSAIWGTLVNTFVLFWVADVFCRGVDVPMVKMTRALGNWAWKK